MMGTESGDGNGVGAEEELETPPTLDALRGFFLILCTLGSLISIWPGLFFGFAAMQLTGDPPVERLLLPAIGGPIALWYSIRAQTSKHLWRDMWAPALGGGLGVLGLYNLYEILQLDYIG
jgi:hypothetical protein